MVRVISSVELSTRLMKVLLVILIFVWRVVVILKVSVLLKIRVLYITLNTRRWLRLLVPCRFLVWVLCVMMLVRLWCLFVTLLLVRILPRR